MPPRTFEFITVKDWCRKAVSARDLLETPRTWLQLLDDTCVTGASLATNPEFSGTTSLNTVIPLVPGTHVAGSILANLGEAVVKDSSLLVLVRDALAITEAYGDLRWLQHQLKTWPQAHNLYLSTVGLDGPRWTMGLKAYELDKADLLTVDGPCLYLTVRSQDKNIYHWLYETLPRLYCLEIIPELANVPLLVREPLTPLQGAILRWMGITNPILVTGGKSVAAKQLLFPSIPAPPNCHTPLLDWLRSRILRGCPAHTGRSDRRLFITRRRDGNGRMLLNEEEVGAMLEGYGFEQLTMNRLSPDEQMNAFREAELVVFPHGAAGSYTLFMQPGTHIVELQSATDTNNALLPLAAAAKVGHTVLFGNAEGPGNDFIVPAAKVENMVRGLLDRP
jgi:hypothetical protein